MHWLAEPVTSPRVVEPSPKTVEHSSQGWLFPAYSFQDPTRHTTHPPLSEFQLQPGAHAHCPSTSALPTGHTQSSIEDAPADIVVLPSGHGTQSVFSADALKVPSVHWLYPVVADSCICPPSPLASPPNPREHTQNRFPGPASSPLAGMQLEELSAPPYSPGAARCAHPQRRRGPRGCRTPPRRAPPAQSRG